MSEPTNEPTPARPGASGDVAPAADEATPPQDAPADDASASHPDSPDVPPSVATLICDALAPRPLTGFEIATAIEALAAGGVESWTPGSFDHRQGYIYPLLFEMRREGQIEARWVDDAAARVRRYGLPGAVWPAPDGVSPEGAASDGAPPPRVPSQKMREFADAATDRLGFAPAIGEEARAEILAHLVAASAEREKGGLSRDEADAAAIPAMGDPWKISADLSRAARGLRTVIFARSLGESIRALGIYDAGILVAIVAAVIFVRAHVLAAYHIPTKSMEPTLHGDREGGDRILVFSLAPPPDRFDIEVFEGWGDDRKQYVKRCIGLPGESVRLLEGDLWIDGRLVRKEGDALDALLFPVFALPAELEAAARDRRTVADALGDRWTWTGGTEWTWAPDGTGEATVADGAEPAELRWREHFRDALYDATTGDTEETGFIDVADGRITADVKPADATARVVLRWARGAERYDAVLCDDEPGVAILVDGAEVARDRTIRLPPGRTTRVRFSSVDRVLRLEVDGELALRHDLPEPSNPRRTSPSAEVSVRLTRGRAAITPVRVERDVHWTGEYEAAERPRLGPDEYFMLGDNSSNSQDSRARGPVHRNRLVGHPLVIVWPPHRFGRPR